MKVKYILYMIIMLTTVSCAQIRDLILLLSGGDDTPGMLQVSTLSADNVGYTSAQVHGLILNNNYDTAVKVLWGADSTFTDSSAVDQDTLSGVGYHTVSYTITGLSGGSNYIYKFVATNSSGRREGSIKNFITTETPAAPLLTLAGSSSITSASAYAHVTIDPNGLSSALELLYGTATGTYTDTLTPSPATYTGYSESEVSKLMDSLSNNTTYYFVWEAVNDSGTVQTDELSFSTLAASGGAPTAISNTSTADSITATLYGAVDPNGLQTTVRFLWGLSDGVWTDSSEADSTPLLAGEAGGGGDPAEPSGNFVDNWGFEDGNITGYWVEPAGSDCDIALNSSTPIYGSYSADVTSTTYSSMSGRPIIWATCTSNPATGTTSAVGVSIRNNDSTSRTIKYVYIGGLVNLILYDGYVTLPGDTTTDVEITGLTSGGTSYGYVAFYMADGNTKTYDLTFDNWWATQ